MESPIRLDRLPGEVLELIIRMVHEEHPRSLGAMLCVNRTLHALATPWRFRNICFNVSKNGSLERDIGRFLESCARSGGLQSIRWVVIDGQREYERAGAEASEADTCWTLEKHFYYGDPTESLETGQEEPKNHDYNPISLEEDLKWRPMVKALESMPQLKDLVFRAEKEFPPSLLATIKEFHPNCRLHLPRFWFRSLRHDVTDEHEMAVVSSPQLHTLGVLYMTRDSGGDDDYGLEATKCLLKGVAPSLRRLTVEEIFPGSSMELFLGRDRPRTPWKGFSAGPWSRLIQPEVKAKLESCTLKGFDAREWHSLLHFDVLTHLSIDGRLKSEDLQWMADQRPFHNLRRLAIRVQCDEYNPPECNQIEEATNFFESLNPLHELFLSGEPGTELPKTILDRHGFSLRHLRFEVDHSDPSLLPKDCALQIRMNCPSLEKLAMPIHRKMGVREEVEHYKALAGLPKLSDLELTLFVQYAEEPFDVHGAAAAIQRRYTDEWMEENWKPSETNGQIYECYINSAIDERLARSIWRIITGDSVGYSLKFLHLIFEVPTCSNAAYDKIFPNRSWTLQRRLSSSNGPESVEFTERLRNDWTANKGGGQLLAGRSRSSEREEATQNREGTILHMFRQIWPHKKEGSARWTEDWESFPLQE